MLNVAFPRERGPQVLAGLGAALGASQSAVAEQHAFAQLVAFAERVAAPSAVFARRCNFSWQLADVPFPAAAEVSGDPAFAWPLACPVAADISCPLRRCRYLAACTCAAAIRWRDCWCWDAVRQHFQDDFPGWAWLHCLDALRFLAPPSPGVLCIRRLPVWRPRRHL